MTLSPLGRMQELGTDFWNDSCSPRELDEAVTRGAVGATSNPVIISAVLKAEPGTFQPVLDGLIAAQPNETDEAIAWSLIENLGLKAARVLSPISERTGRVQGFLSMQVDPTLNQDAERMVEHGVHLAGLAPNIAIKAPCTRAGIVALEELGARGIRLNATVSFTVSQAVSAAEAIERGLARAQGAGLPPQRSDITIMVGRLDDQLQRTQAAEGTAIDPAHLGWAGIAVFKKAHRIFRERGFRSRLLVAAYRHPGHWSELIGPGVAQTIPYVWWKKFEASGHVPTQTLDAPVDKTVVCALERAFPDFARAYGDRAMLPEEFDAFGPTRHTLEQFLGGYRELLSMVRERRWQAISAV